jgi:hypothetical protein
MPVRFIPPAGPPRMLAQAQLTNSIGDGAYYVTSAPERTRTTSVSPVTAGFSH